MSLRESDGQILRSECDHLTVSPGRVEVPKAADSDAGRARRSSTFGTDDDYCHIFVGSPPYRYTSCGQRLKPPVPIGRTHPEPPCPNRNRPCPECVRVREEQP